jgi:hypothetical protein
MDTTLPLDAIRSRILKKIEAEMAGNRAVLVAVVLLANAGATACHESILEPNYPTQYILTASAGGVDLTTRAAIHCDMSATIGVRTLEPAPWLGYAPVFEITKRIEYDSIRVTVSRTRSETPVGLELADGGGVRMTTWLPGARELVGREVDPGVYSGAWTCPEEPAASSGVQVAIVGQWLLKPQRVSVRTQDGGDGVGGEHR